MPVTCTATSLVAGTRRVLWWLVPDWDRSDAGDLRSYQSPVRSALLCTGPDGSLACTCRSSAHARSSHKLAPRKLRSGSRALGPRGLRARITAGPDTRGPGYSRARITTGPDNRGPGYSRARETPWSRRLGPRGLAPRRCAGRPTSVRAIRVAGSRVAAPRLGQP